MKTKKLLPLYIATMLCLAGIVSAACTFEVPGASGILDGNDTINVTGCVLLDIKNCSITAASDKTGDSISTIWLKNTTVNTTLTVTIETRSYLDANDWVFDGTCFNDTFKDDVTFGSESITQRTGVTIDNSVPAITSPSPSDNGRETDGRDITFSVNCTNATEAILYDGRGGSFTMSESADTCSYAFPFLSDGTFKWYVEASDSRNTTRSSTYTMIMSKPGGWTAEDEALMTGAGVGVAKPVSIFTLAVIVLGVWYLLEDKKKKKKK